MKTTKIKLEGLKIESFVTNLKETDLKTVQGGGFTDGICASAYRCRTQVVECFENLSKGCGIIGQ